MSFGVILCTCLNIDKKTSKTTCYRAERSEMWDWGTLVTHILGIFDIAVFNVVLGSFVALVSKWLITKKIVGRKAKLHEIWNLGTLITGIWGSFDLGKY